MSSVLINWSRNAENSSLAKKKAQQLYDKQLKYFCRR